MKQYTKTITVQAVQWTGDNLAEVETFCKTLNTKVCHGEKTNGLLIGLFDVANVNDFIVQVPGRFAVEVVKADDFQRDYKEVTE